MNARPHSGVCSCADCLEWDARARIASDEHERRHRLRASLGANFEVVPETILLGMMWSHEWIELPPDPEAAASRVFRSDDAPRPLFHGQPIARFRFESWLVASDRPLVRGRDFDVQPPKREPPRPPGDFTPGERVDAELALTAAEADVRMAALGIWEEFLSAPDPDFQRGELHGRTGLVQVFRSRMRMRRSLLPLELEGAPALRPECMTHVCAQPSGPFRGKRLIVECRDADDRDAALAVDVAGLLVGNCFQWMGEGAISAALLSPATSPRIDFDTCSIGMRMRVLLSNRSAAPVRVRASIEGWSIRATR